MFAQTLWLFMMSSLSERAPTAAMQAPTSLDVVNIYPASNYSSAKRPWSNSLLGKQKAEMGNKWAVCIWLRLRGTTDGPKCYSKQWHVPVEKVTGFYDKRVRCHLHSDGRVQTSPYLVHTGTQKTKLPFLPSVILMLLWCLLRMASLSGAFYLKAIKNNYVKDSVTALKSTTINIF